MLLHIRFRENRGLDGSIVRGSMLTDYCTMTVPVMSGWAVHWDAYEAGDPVLNVTLPLRGPVGVAGFCLITTAGERH